MGSKVSDHHLSTVRSIVGSEFSDMEIIRALHMAKNDVNAAINIILDTHTAPRFNPTRPNNQLSVSPPKPSPSTPIVTKPSFSEQRIDNNSDDWWLVNCGEMTGLSTCKGRSINSGETVIFKFPTKKLSSPFTGKGFGRAAACSEIVRFSTEQAGEIGRIPKEWARCLLPLVRDHKVRIEGNCKFAPQVLGIMDSIILSVSVFINSSMFAKHHQVSLKDAANSTDESVFHPLPTLFRLLGLNPFKEAELTPGDFYSNKRPLSEKIYSLQVTLPRAKFEHPSQNGNENDNEESISEIEVENIVGVGSSEELEEMDPPANLQCNLRPYQKQALYWMIQMEKGKCMDETATTLHPCWEAYHLADKYASGKGESVGNQPIAKSFTEVGEVSDNVHTFSNIPKKATKFSGFDKPTKQMNSLTSGGNLIICPMTLLGQWKAEIETHVHLGSLSLYVHYGQSRPKDAKSLAHNDVVITTYGILASEFSSEVKFDQFVEQGRVLHNYASILELLLRLRQCCDHPFLVMSRGDTQDFADLNKLAKRFLRGTYNALDGEVKEAPSRAYVQEVVEELRKGEQGECPICLEAFEDAVLTPCAHRLCRECLLASLRNATSGVCPVCRKAVNRQDLITAPTENRFQVDIEKNWVESCKVTALLNELQNLRSSGSKSIVFSQWTAFLDLLQIPFARNNISFVRLDGTLNLQQREKVIKQFSEDSTTLGTVEERMEAVQARKQRMISGALTDQEVRSARIEELKMLFT
ncbi:DNA repair protein [Vigna angularis]|uniref:DNA repair protein n=1 Tax=Phaseolus angularis TaxID=3914 RepID=A0A8T0JE46_PHAAN|nr:DNA repair protein [Vigna angularis]